MGSQMHRNSADSEDVQNSGFLEGSQIRNFDQLNQFISELSVHSVCDYIKNRAGLVSIL